MLNRYLLFFIQSSKGSGDKPDFFCLNHLSSSFNWVPQEGRSQDWWTDNAHPRGVRRVGKCHNVYPIELFMLISVVKVFFLNGPSFSPCEPLKCQKIDFFQLWGQFLRSSRGHREKWIAPLKSAYISGISKIWNFLKKRISVFFQFFRKFWRQVSSF